MLTTKAFKGVFKIMLNWKHSQNLLICIALFFLSACGDSPNDSSVRLPDGSVYDGEMRDGLFHGQGQLQYLEGGRYQGRFVDGLFDGEGSLFYFNGDVYHGQFSRGQLTGKGRYTTSDGDSYEGDFHQGKASGTLRVESERNAYTYQGQMQNWQFSGKGVFTRESETYIGEFAKGYYHGKGHLRYENDGEYAGQFVDGEFNGNGVYKINGYVYSGQFVDGVFKGYGRLETPDSGTYEGQFDNWSLHGKGKFTDPQGNVVLGDFDQGYASGAGQYIGVDGRRYSGYFDYGQFSGAGILRFADGRHYHGEFYYGRYHGQGKLLTPADGEKQETVQQGRWRKGRLVYNDITKQSVAAQAEIALEKHQALLDKAIDDLRPTEAGKRNLYFLGVAGDGTQSVFRREVESVSAQLQERFGIEGRQVRLINDHETAQTYPLATTRSFSQAVNGIAEKMDKENDVLFVYLTSHGSKEHELVLGHDSIDLPLMSASELGNVIRDSGIKWKVIIVSACFSGGFIPELNDGSTLIMTAADADNASFGCSDDSKMTYFGKALFNEVLAIDSKVNLHDAFYKARGIVLEWEQEQELTPSNPQMTEQQDVVDFLQVMLK